MSEVFDGTVEVQDGGGNTTVLLDGGTGIVTAGSNGKDGEVSVRIAAGSDTIQLNASAGLVRAGGGGTDGVVEVRNAADVTAVLVTGQSTGAAGVYIGDGTGNPAIDLLSIGRIAVRQVLDGEARAPIVLEATSTASITAGCEGSAGIVKIRNESEEDSIVLDGAEGNLTVQRNLGGSLRPLLAF